MFEDSTYTEVPETTVSTSIKTLKEEDFISDLRLLLCYVNGVTVFHRHGQKIPTRRLDELANFQIDIERKYGFLGG